jgi:hypothetical protein
MPEPDDDATTNGDPLTPHVREILKELGEDPDR